ncbi:phage tail spike protein [Streptococcus sp. 343_SSPC]|uniref:phage tail spike protein n=1 Tax=Streptococcus sp. 343_SSPC TaxID=1579342 RepID=UPI00069F303F|nr:phage tail spike protein [Streptococcus sp. 343_SSPC]
MRPILFNKNEQSFDTYGLGELNVTKGTVTRERNRNYTLYAEIPVNDPMVSILQKEMKLKADAGLRTKNQTFEISRIVKDSSNIVKIYGQHISHKLEYMAIINGLVLNGTAFNALSLWRNALIGDYRFDVWSDIQASATTTLTIDKATNARLALGGVEGSILDIWGGEYEFDNMVVRLHKQLGRTAPTVLEYGRNILSAETDETIEDAYTSVLPFATYTPEKPEGDTSESQPDPITVTIPENYVDSKYKALYAHRRIKVVDFSSEFNSDSKKKNIPTADKLRKLASDYMERNAIGKPKINTKIEYVDLAKTLDYADRAWIEELELCDIVPIYYPQIGLTDETAKVTTITYDFVNERNASVEFGEIGTNVRATMQSGLAGKVDEIAKAQQNFENSLPDYLLNAQGNKVWYNRPGNKEHKVGDIWFEKNGLYDRMYIWNGSMWEKRIDTEDVDRVKKEVNRQLEEAKTTTDRAIAEANKRAEEALKKAGTLPDTSKLSDQIKQQILSSQDLTQKVTETLNQTDSGVIYNKILQNVKNEFVPKTKFDELERSANNGISYLMNKSDKAEIEIRKQTIEFNKLTESNKIYERILGTSETDAPDKLSRLVMSSEIFQTEVGKYSTQGGPNMLRNSRADDGLKHWNGDPSKFKFLEHHFYLNGQKRMFLLENGAVVNSPRFIFKRNADYILNLTAFDANTARVTIELRKRKKDSANQDYDERQIIFDKTGSPAFNSDKAVKRTFKFNTGDFDNGYLLFIYDGVPNVWSGMFMTELDFYEGTADRKWQPAPEDSEEPIEAVRTQVTQLAGSWSVRNLNSAGDVLGAINLNPDGSVRINEGLLSVGEKTIIKDGVIKKSMIGKAQIGTAHIDEIDASKANLINVTAKNIATDGLTANIIKGGILQSINGATNFDLNQGVFKSMGEKTGLVLHGGALDFIGKNGVSVAGYSTYYDKYGRLAGGAVGSHTGYDFFISTKSGGNPMIVCTDNGRIEMNSDFMKMRANKIMFPSNAVIVSDNASDTETVGLNFLRYNKGGGWCTAFVNSRSGSGIEFYDNGNVRILRYGQIWEPGK